MIKAIIFDLGGVIVEHTQDIDLKFSPLWPKAVEGEISDDLVLEDMAKLNDITKDRVIEKYFEHLHINNSLLTFISEK